VDKINKFDLKSNFIGICVDNNREEIPSYVKCVPTIFVAGSRNLLVDDQVKDFIDSLIAKTKEDVEPQGFGHSMLFSDSFAVLSSNDDGTDDMHAFESYNNVKDVPNNAGVTPENVNNKQRMNTEEMEKYVFNRDRDTELAKRTQQQVR
jgi:hypothetical protein